MFVRLWVGDAAFAGEVVTLEGGVGGEMQHAMDRLRATVEEFAHDVIAPVIGDLYERGEFPYAIVKHMGDMGLFGLIIPEEHGGLALGKVTGALASEISAMEGSWAVRGGVYVWTGGYWSIPRNGHVWINGHWKHRRGGWVWVPGHWRRRR